MPVPTACKPLAAEARSGSPRIWAGLYQARARSSTAVGVPCAPDTLLSPMQNGMIGEEMALARDFR